VIYETAGGPTPPLVIARLNSDRSLCVTRPSAAHYIVTTEELRRRTNDGFSTVYSSGSTADWTIVGCPVGAGTDRPAGDQGMLMELRLSNEPLVTICIPTYNRPEMLRQSLQSVLLQSYRNFEVIVSDNASDTDTAAVVDSFGDHRVRVDRLPANIGLHRNMSRCLQLGTGKYRVMLPDDDSMLPGNLESKVAFFETHPKVGLVHSAFREIDSDAQPHGPVLNWTSAEKDTVQPGYSYIRESIAKGGITWISSVMLRSDLVADEAFVADDGPYCDLGLWLRVAQRADVGFLMAPLSGYRLHASSASSGFQTVVEVRGRLVNTLHHTDALKLAVGRFIESADLDPQLRAEYARLQRASDRRTRLAILADRYLPRLVFKLAKRSVNWVEQGRIYNAISPLRGVRTRTG
jgi:glycosyltransferase involved in cell wall biosynthesis